MARRDLPDIYALVGGEGAGIYIRQIPTGHGI